MSERPRPVIRLTSRQAADYLGVSTKTLARWRDLRRQGLDRGPVHFAPRGAMPFYVQADLDEFLARSRVAPSRPAAPSLARPIRATIPVNNYPTED
jgi:hypothetical protein